MDPASKQAYKYQVKTILGTVSDKLDVGMAKIRGEESAALDVAIIKATLQDEVVPKEKHVRTLKLACGAQNDRQTVNYVIHGLVKRLEENPKAWLVTLKTLIVFHRLMRETDPSFQEELLRYAERTGHHRMLRLESFADHTTKETWDYSAWVRVYSVYLDERLAVFRTMRFDPEQDQGLEGRESKLKSCPAAELLEHLPAAQRLLRQLVSCVPEGAAQQNEISLLACSLVLKEIRSVYKAVSEGVLNIVDRIFEMDRGDALKGVELVKENLTVNERLNAFVGTIGSIQPLKGAVQFPVIQPLPADFLTTLEEYIKDAPKSAGDAGKPIVGRSASTASKAGLRLIVGGPIKDPPSGPTSPPGPGTAPAPEVDLLGDFDTLTITPGPSADAVAAPTAVAAPAAPPSAAAAAPFDPFANFAAAPVAAVAPATGLTAPYPLGVSSSFANPAAAAVVAGLPSAAPPSAQPSAMAAPPGVSFNEHMLGAANAFGAPPPAAYSPPGAAPPAPLPEPMAAQAAPFNPFVNPSMHATVAPYMPQGAAPAPQTMNAFAPPPPLLPQHFVAASPAPVSAPQTPAGSQTPVTTQFAAHGGPPGAGGLPPHMQPPAFANPFGSPGGPGPQQPGGGYGSPGGPSPTNPFGAPGAAAPSGTTAGANPFGAAWAGPTGGPVLTQNVGGYSLKKPADPLNVLSMDLFGKPQAPPSQQPMRPQAGAPQNGGGSPSNFF
ncbi:hypothetical protein PLESTB_001052300 [Pleodorina starrii]|uniref:ENTH domain-containing protein n=1 Tax=Pleodorina starrii TaxID=330485 RepID=A0A9W6BPX8_9CHLO|nr:hypothetical protein PLESTM_001270700 [Pleodorina starrii]GLC55988.1 hypothetical protein PLESTB_001052300 [Pleodorina starrii]GLC63975.1 hypothetical protein PLESTF_000104800 [Pleodorina starrii]